MTATVVLDRGKPAKTSHLNPQVYMLLEAAKLAEAQARYLHTFAARCRWVADGCGTGPSLHPGVVSLEGEQLFRESRRILEGSALMHAMAAE